MADTVITIYFKSGSFIPELTEQKKLLIAFQDSAKVSSIKGISGFTDSVGAARDNMLLANKRIEYIIYLLRKQFVLSGDYDVNNYGEQKPVSHTDLSKNRRVEISLSPLKINTLIPDTGKFKVIRSLELEHLYFRPDEPILEPSSMPYLNYVANMLKKDNKDIFEIKGHVNWSPSSNSSPDLGYKKKMDQLSADRARLIYDILVDKGIPPGRMFWKGMGNTEMIYPNATSDEEKRKNMRVEILVLKKSDQ